MPTQFRGVPGVYVGQSLTPRNIFSTYGPNVARFVSSNYLIDGTNSRDPGNSPVTLLRTGLILGKTTASKKYRPSILGLTTAAAINTATSVSVPASVAAEVARLIANAGASVNITFAGPPAAAGVVATQTKACSAASGTTLTVAALTAALAAGSLVQPADGSATPETVLTAEYGVDVTDVTGGNLDQRLDQFCIAGDLITANLINAVTDDFGNAADTSVTAYIKTQLRTFGQQFTFSDDR